MCKVIDFYGSVVMDTNTGKVVVATKKTVRRLVNQSKFQTVATMARLPGKPIA